MTDKAYAVPLHELLASVPREARLVIDDDDGMGTRFIPVGRYCNEAAEALRARLAQHNQFNPDWDAMAVMVEEQQRMAKRIEELKERLLQVELNPPQREWQGLTDEEIIKLQHLIDWTAHWSTKKFARAIEAKLKEKNAPNL